MVRMFAAIDVGSFELELGIYELSDKHGVREIDHIKHMIALGKDTYNDGKISYGLVDEMCQVLADFALRMKTYQVEDYRAYATSALREAKNNQIVLDQIRVRTGLEIRIISNSEQRFISYKAIASKDAEFHKIIQKGTAIVDVGFGSMQISLFDKDTLVSTQNIPLGILRLREMVCHVNALAKLQQEITVEIIDSELQTFRKLYLKDREIGNLIGIGDAILTLFYKMYEMAGVSGCELRERVTVGEFNLFFEHFRKMTPEQIQDTFGIRTEYASMLIPAALIYKRVLELTGAEVIWIPQIRMTDGIAAEYAENKKVLKFNHSFENDIIVTSRNMAKRYKGQMSHIQVVETMALNIFDNLKKYHGLKGRERLLLQIAANLHSCGKYISIRNGTDCAYNIIMSTEIIGLSHLEREIVANIVKYNNQEFRYNEVSIEAKPSKQSRLVSPDNLILVIAKLTALLRLANCMDRGHRGKLQGSKMRIREKELVITTGFDGDVTLEKMAIEQGADFFEEIYGIRPALKQKKRV